MASTELEEVPAGHTDPASAPKVRALIGLAIQSRLGKIGEGAKKLEQIGGYDSMRMALEADAAILATIAAPQFSEEQLDLIGPDPQDVRAHLSLEITRVMEKKHLRGPDLGDGEDDLAINEAADAVADALFAGMKAMFDAGYATGRAELANDPILWWPKAVAVFHPADDL